MCNHRRSTSGESASTCCRIPRTACCRFLVSLRRNWYSVATQKSQGTLSPDLVANSSMLHDRSLATGLRTSRTVNVLQMMKKSLQTKRESQSNEKPTQPLERSRFLVTDQVRCQEPRVVNGDGKRPRVENEAAPGDTTDTTEDVDPEVKRGVTDAPVEALPQVLGGIVDPPGLLPRRRGPPLCAAAAGLGEPE